MDVARLGISVESRQVDDANRSLERFTQVSGSAERAAKGLGRQATTAGRAAQAANDNAASSANKAAMAYGQWERYARLVSRALGAVTAALATGALVSYADTWSDLSARVGLAVGNMDAAPMVMQRLATIADNTYSSMELTAEAFTRNAASLRELGLSTEDQLQYLASLNDALVVSGARGDRARQVQDALSKAMALGKLSGDELNAVLTHGGAVAAALAEELGVTQNALRQLGADGEITSDIIQRTMIKRVDEFREKAGLMPATIEDGMGRIRNAILQTVGVFDQQNQLSESVAEGFVAVADAIKVAGQNLEIIGRVATVAGVALATAFGPAIFSAIVSGFMAMQTAGVGALNAITAAALRNPFTALATAILVTISAVWLFRDEIKQAFGVDVEAIVKGAANTIINSFALAYENIKATWAALPAVMGQIVTATVNGVITGLEFMVNGAIRNINNLISAANAATGLLPGGGSLQIPTVPEAEFGRYQNRDGDAIGRLQRDMAANAGAVMSRDNFAGWDGSSNSDSSSDSAAIEELNRQLSAVPEKASAAGAAMDEAGKKGGSAADKAAKEAQKLADAYDKIVMKANQRITDLQNEAAALGMTEEAAARLRYEQEMMNEAQNAGITLTAAQRAELSGLAATMASVEAETKRAKDQLDFAKGSTNSFLSDLRSGLNQGKGFFESFGTAALNVLDKIIDKLQGQFVDALFGATSGGGKGGSGLFGGVIGAVGKLLGFSSGGWTGGGAANAAAGIVHGQEFVVRAGPAAQHRDMLEAINAGRAPANANAPAPAPQPVAITVNVEGANGDKHVMDLVRQGVTQGLSQYDRAANGSMTDKRRRGVA